MAENNSRMTWRPGLALIALLALWTFSPPVAAVCPQPPETDGGMRKGLTQRNFQKSLRHEVGLFGGVYVSDLMGAAPLSGINYTFHINEDFGIEAGFAYAWLSSAFAQPVERFTGYDLLEDHAARMYTGSLVWHPFHGKFMAFRSAVPHFDWYFLAGAGITDSRNSEGLTYTVGTGFKIFCANWLSIRIEVRDHIHVQQLLASEAVTNNLSLSLGVGLWVPLKRQ